MKRMVTNISLILLLGLLIGGNGCILEDKVIQIVLTDETFADFPEFHTSANWNTPKTLDYGEKIGEILAENGFSREDILSAKLVAAFYGVTEFSHAHDWMLSGTITVRRNDITGPTQTIITYTNQSVAGALGEKIQANLDPLGVALLNQALEDFIGGANPVLTFEVVNDGVTPVPTTEDPIEFDWRAWLNIQIIIEDEISDVPDPF